MIHTIEISINGLARNEASMLEYNFFYFAVNPSGQTPGNDRIEALRSSRLTGHWKSTLIKTHRWPRRTTTTAAYELLSNTVITSVLTFRARMQGDTKKKQLQEQHE